MLQGLPITLTIAENDASGAYVERVIRPTYEDCCKLRGVDKRQWLMFPRD